MPHLPPPDPLSSPDPLSLSLPGQSNNALKFEKFVFAGNKEALYLPPALAKESAAQKLKKLFIKLADPQKIEPKLAKGLQKELIHLYLYNSSSTTDFAALTEQITQALPDDDNVKQELADIAGGAKKGEGVEGVTCAVKGSDNKWSFLTSGLTDIDVRHGKNQVATVRKGEVNIIKHEYMEGLYMGNKSQDVEASYKLSLKLDQILPEVLLNEKENYLKTHYQKIEIAAKQKKEANHAALEKETLQALMQIDTKKSNEKFDAFADEFFTFNKGSEPLSKDFIIILTEREYDSIYLGVRYQCRAEGNGIIITGTTKEGKLPNAQPKDIVLFKAEDKNLVGIKNGNLDELLKPYLNKNPKSISVTTLRKTKPISEELLDFSQKTANPTSPPSTKKTLGVTLTVAPFLGADISWDDSREFIKVEFKNKNAPSYVQELEEDDTICLKYDGEFITSTKGEEDLQNLIKEKVHLNPHKTLTAELSREKKIYKILKFSPIIEKETDKLKIKHTGEIEIKRENRSPDRDKFKDEEKSSRREAKEDKKVFLTPVGAIIKSFSLGVSYQADRDNKGIIICDILKKPHRLQEGDHALVTYDNNEIKDLSRGFISQLTEIARNNKGKELKLKVYRAGNLANTIYYDVDFPNEFATPCYKSDANSNNKTTKPNEETKSRGRGQ